MAESYRPEFNYNQAPSPGRTYVSIDANQNIELGKMVVTVAGYGRIPAAADAATGRMRGVAEDTVNNNPGLQGAKSVSVRPGVFCFKNNSTHPLVAADVGKLVYASDGDTVSYDSTDGPKAGTLIEFVTNSPQGTPCKVVLLCDAP